MDLQVIEACYTQLNPGLGMSSGSKRFVTRPLLEPSTMEGRLMNQR